MTTNTIEKSAPKITLYSLYDYTNGDLIPFTIDLSLLTDIEEFNAEILENLKKITEIKNDAQLREECIVAGYENIPYDFIGAYGLYSEFFEYQALIDSGIDTGIIDAGIELEIPLDKIEDAFFGEYDSDEDFAQEYAENTQGIDYSNLPWPQNCIDWQEAASELIYDFISSNGYYFIANW